MVEWNLNKHKFCVLCYVQLDWSTKNEEKRDAICKLYVKLATGMAYENAKWFDDFASNYLKAIK